MKFKADSSTQKASSSTAITTATTSTQTKSKDSKSKSAGSTTSSPTFSINRSSFTGTLADIVPGEMKGWLGEIGAQLGGIDLNQPLSWSKEQVIEANKIASNLDKKLIEMTQVKTAVLKFLSYSMQEADLKAEITVAMAKAKGYIDQKQAKAHLAYFAYLRKANRLEKKVAATQEIIDTSNSALENTFDDRKAQLLGAINTQAKLGQGTTQQVTDLRNKRRELIEQHKQEMASYRNELQTGQLTAAAS
ncbi:hypothetical protein HW132_12820 [Brasilonema sp. CT11]|nr:hypothetical protein [Brasilonema sp. CT11]